MKKLMMVLAMCLAGAAAFAAQKKFDLAVKVAEGKIKLEAAKADMDNVINTAQHLDQTKWR